MLKTLRSPKISFNTFKMGRNAYAIANASSSASGVVGGSSSSDSFEQPDEFTLISWNIDGLDDKNRALRTEAACGLVKQIRTDIFFFQEVIPETEEIMKVKMNGYKLLSADNDPNTPYYTLIGIRERSVKLLDHQVINFSETRMGRNLNQAMVEISGVKIKLMTSHLESCWDSSPIRVQQLEESFDIINKTPESEVVIFGGDMNLRDSEMRVSSKIQDVWKLNGSRRECEYTWDMMRNDNHVLESRRSYPRHRFDRLYLRNSSPKRVMPEYFGLIGLERLKPHVCFPSDHWGLLSAFKLR
ncbi:tyrosyl-DNA phosphodiesterase 2-like isoform X2 [Brevipalpus obovatus]|uniref:tyrosyl-DNA phosphodiesterase 2-like isoform X2 n=1 Tax=Brevipalpus obovatus TaxID=246614 RepID=UPI003D9F58BA